MKAELMNGTPPGSTYACHSSGWIQNESFVVIEGEEQIQIQAVDPAQATFITVEDVVR